MSKAMTAATKEQLIELMQYLSQNISVPTIGIGGGFAPIGTIISYMGTTAPQDYLICDGTTYNIADYKQLSDFFAAQFGSANFFGSAISSHSSFRRKTTGSSTTTASLPVYFFIIFCIYPKKQRE